ncbi:type II secretion system minor pseudopilin GspK [Solimonas soli]|uniref:type II secretion system minor pseudopilin GspK n=1 Tax=Solimonas soli TaxID=413479 RepID=UPI0009FDFC9C|nr:type II secretion system minor pseudopilin GspK [Solimonas soli]
MRRRQRGIALITAVLVVALAAIAAAAILTSANLAIHRTQNLQESELGWWYVDGVESWVKTILQRDTEINKYDALSDIWAMPAALPVDEGGLRGVIIDLQGRYNVNNLGLSNATAAGSGGTTATVAGYPSEKAFFSRLYALATGGDAYQGEALADAIRDYVDADSEPTGSGGAEDADYLGMDPPRRVPNRPLQSVSELLGVRGMTPEIYGKLAPYLSALPKLTPLNVNTAAPLLLQALTPQPGTELEQFVTERLKQPVESISDFNKRVQLGAGAVPSSMLSYKSDYFQLQVEAYIGSGRLELYSFLYRAGSAAPVVYGRSTFTE